MAAKGTRQYLFRNQTYAAISDEAVDCRGFNAVRLDVTVVGTTPGAILSLEGADSPGGQYQPLLNGNLGAIVQGGTFEVATGAASVKVRLSSITGTYTANQGYTVIGMPYEGSGSSDGLGAVAVLDVSTVNIDLIVGRAGATQVAPPGAKGLILHFNIGTVSGSPTYTPRLDGFSPQDGTWFTAWQGAGQTTQNDYFYWLHPSAATNASFTAIAAMPLPRVWRFYVVYNGAGTGNSATTKATALYLA